MTHSTAVKLVLALGILISIAMTYHAKIVRNDFEILSNPDGLPSLDE